MTVEKISNNYEKSEKVKERFLNDFKILRYEFIDDISDEILEPEMPNYQLYKCRIAFFGKVASSNLRMQHEGVELSNETKIKCKEFDDFCETLKGTYRRITKKDIDKANEVLEIVINELS